MENPAASYENLSTADKRWMSMVIKSLNVEDGIEKSIAKLRWVVRYTKEHGKIKRNKK